MSYKDSENKSSDKRNVFLSQLSEKKIKIVGLTGVIGAGKSSVITILNQLDIPVIDCDRLNEELQQPDEEGYRKIIAFFGNDILDSSHKIDKEKLASLIFHDEEKKTALEEIMHPLIKQRIIEIIKCLQSPLVVVEVPLLFEIHWEACFDEIWVVACQEDILLQRLSTQRNVTIEEAKLRLSHQMSQVDKIAKADKVIHNDSDRDDLKQQIIQILGKG